MAKNHSNQDVDKTLAKAEAYLAAGNLALAAKRYRDYLASVPNDGERWHQLAGVEYAHGNIREAIRAAERAVKLRPRNPEFRNDLGTLHLMANQLEKAMACYQDLLRIAPEFLPAKYNLADLHFRQGHFEETETLLLETLKAKPDWPEANFNLGVAYARHGYDERALQYLLQAYRLNPQLLGVAREIAGLYAKMRYHTRAIEFYKIAVAQNPDDVDAAIGVAMTEHEEGKTDSAVQRLEASLRSHPDNPKLETNLGDLWRSTGKNHEAERMYDLALSHHTHYTAAIFGKSRCRKFSLDDKEWLRYLETALRDNTLSPEDRSIIHYALSKTYDDCACFEAAFVHARNANELQKELHPENRYDRLLHETFISEIIETCSTEWTSPPHNNQEKNRITPIFVIGMPRSGTTLTEQILASHPTVRAAGELIYFGTVSKRLADESSEGIRYPMCLVDLKDEALKNIKDGYLTLLQRHGNNASQVVDKNPFNFLYLGLIARLFPESPIIHCLRDPRDICLSIYFQSFDTYSNYAWDLLDTGHYLLQYQRLMRHWKSVVTNPVFELHYEQLVREPESTTRDLLDICGLEWDERCLRFYQGKQVVRTASDMQVRQPIYKSSTDRWQNYSKHLISLTELLGLGAAEGRSAK